MERKDTGKNILIAFLVIIVVLLVGFIAFNLGKENANDGNDNVVEQGGQNNNEVVDYNTYVQSGNTLAQIDQRKVTLNGNEHKLTLIYSYKMDKEQFQDYEYDVYAYYLTVLYDDKTTDISNLEIARKDAETNQVITDFKNEYVNSEIISDTKNNDQYLVFAVQTKPGSDYAAREYYGAIYDGNGNKMYSNNVRTASYLHDLNGKSISFVELSSNSLKVIDFIPNCSDNSKDIGKVYQNTITMENGHYATLKEEITNKVNASGAVEC